MKNQMGLFESISQIQFQGIQVGWIMFALGLVLLLTTAFILATTL